MPFYSFLNDKTQEVRDIFFKMNDDKQYVDEDGFRWRRLFSNPNMSMDTRVNPFSAKDFSKKTQGAKTYGEMFDLSAEMSRQRAEKVGGDDPQRARAEKEFYNPKKKNKKI